MSEHEFFMQKVLKLAELGRGIVNPNPMVGALIVKNGKIISSAYHERPGRLHAEAIAIKKAGNLAKGAVLYVNLEPCSHIGRTPPCVKAVINSGIKEVYCSMLDPNPLNNGKGIKILKKNNIKVHVGILRHESEKLNEVFVKYITKKMPFVTVKAAQSLDGKIATRNHHSKWITSEISRNYSHSLRSEVDAVLVGINTIIRDNPLLTSRRRKTPVKVVIDPFFKISEQAKIFSKKSHGLSIVAVFKDSVRDSANLKKAEHLHKKGILVIRFNNHNGRILIRDLLKELAGFEISHLLVEGGGNTIAGFVEERLVDRVLFFIAPKIIGGKDAITSVEGIGAARVDNALKLKDIIVEKLGEDILIKGEAESQGTRHRTHVRYMSQDTRHM